MALMMPWATIRAVAASIYDKADRVVRRVGEGSAAAVGGVNGMEKQPTFACWAGRGRNLARTVCGGGDGARVERDNDPAVDSANDQISLLTVMKIATVLSALYMGAAPWIGTLFHHAGEDFMCPRLVVCARSLVEMALLTGSRFTAGLVYPGLVISIFSKCYVTRSFLHHSWYGAVINCEPTHDMHTYFGYLTLVASYVHSVLHVVRYVYADAAYILYETDACRSGLIACLLMLPIVLPMKFEFLRTKVSFQFRKNLHMLFLPMLVALCFHSAVFRYVGLIIIVWYSLDRVYFTSKQTFLIDHPDFEAVGRGTMVTLDLPTGYTFKAGSYIYVNSPRISRTEWHPFSIIQVPGSPPRATFYAEAVGDWTKELFRLGLEQPRLPLWITAAQPSLMEKSLYYDNVVLVCTGAGITPAVSIIERYTLKKNIHLLWMSRDGGMVALFEKQLRQVHSTVHLTGTPTEDTKGALQSLLQPSAIDDEEANTRRSFRSSTIPKSKRAVDDAIQQRGAGNVIFGNGDSPSPRHMMLSMLRRESDLSGRPQRLDRYAAKANTMPEAKPGAKDPVKLLFGRPDIGVYLTETFAAQTEAHGTPDDSGFLTSGPSLSGASVSSTGIARAARLPGRQESKRLDPAQKMSKEKLLKADQTVLTSRQPQEAIATTCDELRVDWQKEYFGAW